MKQTFKNKKRAASDSKLLTQTDYICISVLVLIFTILAFFRLGNTYAPSSSYTANSQNPDIILDFGEYTDIAFIAVFLGDLDTRYFSISAFNEITGEWDVFNEAAVANTVFAWNKININYRLRYLGIVALDDSAVINELVAVRTDATFATPINAGSYPALFDEQNMFPEANSYMAGTMFDEIYHGCAAYQFVHGLPTNRFSINHPHLGKILISIGIILFGMNPFGWRFMSVLFGILFIPLMYIFARKLFKNSFIAAATASLLTFDCMHYTLSRIATFDIFVAYFILLMYYYMYQYFEQDALYRSTHPSSQDKFPPRNVYLPLAFCGISMALGIATKWTGVFAGAGLAILFIWYTITHYPGKQTLRLFFFCCLFFIAVPLIIYVLCFIPVVGDTQYNGLIDKAIQGSKYMFDYHSNLISFHYYSSPFYEWPVIWMPLLDASDIVGINRISAVSTMGNPAIWWIGIPCQLFVFFRWIIKKDKKAGFLCIAYLAQYVPWMAISRMTFIYHYFPASLFMILMLGYTMLHVKEHFSWGKKAVTAYLAIAYACFFLFFPVISGLPVPREYGLALRWLKDWILVV